MDLSPPASHHRSELEPWAVELARQTVRAYVRTFGKMRDYKDEEDLQQDVLLHWLTKRHTYRPGRGASIQTYFRRIAENRLADLRREAHALARGGGTRMLSLELPVAEHRLPLADLIEDHVGQVPQQIAEDRELAQAVNQLAGSLTERQRNVLAGLLHAKKVTDIAAELGVNRATVHRERDAIRQAALRWPALLSLLGDATPPEASP